MEDIVLRADIDGATALYVSPISRRTYDEHIHDNVLGNERGYFVIRSRSTGVSRLEVLAKAPSLEAAEALFDLIVAGLRRD